MANYRTNDLHIETCRFGWPSLNQPKTKGMHNADIIPRYEVTVLVPKLAPTPQQCPNYIRLWNLLNEAMIGGGVQTGAQQWPPNSNHPIVDGDLSGKEATQGFWQIVPKKYPGDGGYRPRLAVINPQGSFDEYIGGTPGTESFITHGDHGMVLINAYFSEKGRTAAFGLSMVGKTADGELPGGGGDTRDINEAFGAPAGAAPMQQAPMGQAPVPPGQAHMGQPPMQQTMAPPAPAPMQQAPMGQLPMQQAPMGQPPQGAVGVPPTQSYQPMQQAPTSPPPSPGYAPPPQGAAPPATAPAGMTPAPTGAPAQTAYPSDQTQQFAQPPQAQAQPPQQYAQPPMGAGLPPVPGHG